MRIVLVTGKGGVGKTTVAAATAIAAADAGHRTLVTSTDPAHSLADALAIPLGTAPSRVVDGLEVARRLRASPWSTGTRLIALTGYGQPEDIRHALEAGFEAHLTKPINLDQLLSLIGESEAG